MAENLAKVVSFIQKNCYICTISPHFQVLDHLNAKNVSCGFDSLFIRHW